MTILVFWKVDNSLNWQRGEFDFGLDEDAFRRLWENRSALNARFYDMESHYGDMDVYDIGYHPWWACSDELEDDFNNEDFDNGGWWCKSLHVPSDDVKEIMGHNDGTEMA